MSNASTVSTRVNPIHVVEKDVNDDVNDTTSKKHTKKQQQQTKQKQNEGYLSGRCALELND